MPHTGSVAMAHLGSDRADDRVGPPSISSP
jgi:hypothetical protein